ncbi:hypothetical protein OG563_47415 [Nocardia vinacea]|uniref:Uncharacterized protein n=1 Tax=Nocardia vinacea TaxID=96468 RepID=A0ABZ1YXH1_9NOCA|nr:hypothetical protein [Nocardia vinacea]
MTVQPLQLTQAVAALLAAAGVTPTEQEIAVIAEGYPAMLTAIEALYRVPGSGDDEPATVFCRC